MTGIEEIKHAYALRRKAIEERLARFENRWRACGDEEFFEDLCFCLLTPQSKARVCWMAVERLREDGLLSRGTAADVEKRLAGVRFKKKKARYVIEARGMLGSVREVVSSHGAAESRTWLARNVKGLGMKEASHFLRNVGLGRELAILDRHILKNMCELGVIVERPASVAGRRYLDLEEKLKGFCGKTGIPLSHADLLFWSRETGEIFK